MTMEAKYNISADTKIPQVYDMEKMYNGGELDKLKRNGFSLNMRRYVSEGTILDIRLGDKFYTFKNHNICAMKVMSIILSYGNRIFYEVLYADGEHEIRGNMYGIFKSIRDCRKYQECVANKSGCPDRFYIKNRITRRDYITDILSQCDLRIYRREVEDYSECGIEKWYSSDCGISVPLNPNFRYLWLDKDGLHFELLNKYTNPSGGLGSTSNKTFYDTKEECDGTHKVIDFEDEGESRPLSVGYFSITNMDDVTRFFKYIAFTLECSLYPGDDFSDMIDTRTEEPMFSTADANRLNRYMDACFRVCAQHNVDIYAHAVNITC